ncbi:glycoside hydrolase family 51 protein [Botryobasidium botryosum FD-172 SS1]|uniref:non-reducing end alpha-L-arabinofuranosidase n=1 Tax=Botryobasidium botryosum (strain FD-172 SS1) TaxID=930990 RepID=A0A067N3F3_BOTB1|nr:glycoside hydrolase family 51 protein [Botryobasidium botryosum FD-172 SS1]
MFEDINHSGDGGLYAELLQNRAFQGVTPGTSAALTAWTAVGGGQISVIKDSGPVSSALPNSLQFIVPSTATSSVGFKNTGYWGMKVQQGLTYKASFYAKLPSASSLSGSITVSLVGSSGQVLASGTISGLTTAWKQYQLSLTATASGANANNAFQLTVDGAQNRGKTINFSMFSLFPPTFKNRANGMRTDIAQPLADIKPSFFRFPGGNNIEGQSIATFWNWTNTIGPLVNRPGRPGDWGYYNTDGLGLLEYLNFCEDTGMEPIMAVYAGYSLDGSSVPQADINKYVQHAINQINFVIGDASTNQYAAMRSQYGHPTPFKLEYVEIGNEDFFREDTYQAYRWAAFKNGIQAAFPQLKLISTASYGLKLSPAPSFIDLHVYQTPEWFIQNNEIYKSRSAYPLTGPHILEGEFAVTATNSSCLYGPISCGRLDFPSLRGSVAEATFMAGLERDSNLVFGACYAPLLQNINSAQWTPDLVSFDATNTILSTSYYVQQMFSANRGDTILVTTASTPQNPLFWVVSKNSQTKQVFVKLTNTGTQASALTLNFTDLTIGSSGQATVLTNSNYNAKNTPQAPRTVVPTTSTITAGKQFTYNVPAQSVVVLALTYA